MQGIKHVIRRPVLRGLVVLATTAVAFAASVTGASALTRPTEGSLVQVYPSQNQVFFRLVDGAGVETVTGLIPGDGVDRGGPPRSDVDSQTGLAYVLWDGVVTRIDLLSETNLGEFASSPAGIFWFAITLDDSTDALYVVGWNNAESLLQLDQIDRETGEVAVVGLLPVYLTFPNLDDIAAADGTIYFQTNVSRIWTLDVATLTLGDEIDFPLSDALLDASTSLDVDSHGLLHAVWHYAPSAEGWAMDYDLVAGEWGSPDEFDVANAHNGLATVSFSWWAPAADDPVISNSGNLAETGFDPSGIALAAVAMAGAGALALRRRARR